MYISTCLQWQLEQFPSTLPIWWAACYKVRRLRSWAKDFVDTGSGGDQDQVQFWMTEEPFPLIDGASFSRKIDLVNNWDFYDYFVLKVNPGSVFDIAWTDLQVQSIVFIFIFIYFYFIFFLFL